MIDYRVALKKGLFLEDYNILIEWDITIQKLLEKISGIEGFVAFENAKCNYYGYKILAKILGASEEFGVTFNFVKGKMTSVNISHQWLGLNIQDSFNQMQNFLVERFGKPNGISKLLDKIFSSKDERTYKWNLDNVNVVHSLFEGFDLQELIEIRIK